MVPPWYPSVPSLRAGVGNRSFINHKRDEGMAKFVQEQAGTGQAAPGRAQSRQQPRPMAQPPPQASHPQTSCSIQCTGRVWGPGEGTVAFFLFPTFPPQALSRGSPTSFHSSAPETSKTSSAVFKTDTGCLINSFSLLLFASWPPFFLVNTYICPRAAFQPHSGTYRD